MKRMQTKKPLCGRLAALIACVCITAAVSSYAIDNPVTTNYTLTADETVTEKLTVNSGVTVDVAGHKLTVHGIDGTGTVTSSAAGGVLDICIPGSTDSFVLDSTTISGGANMQVWKTGAGFLQMLKVNAGFGTGGAQASPGPVAFVVKEGRVKKGNDSGSDSPNGPNTFYCGAGYCTIKVERGGQFDIGGRITWDYNYDIAGDGPADAPVKGALINTVQPSSNPWTWVSYRGYLYNVTLSDDASIGGSCIWTLNFWQSAGSYPPWLKLNGHVLTFASGTIYPGENRTYNGAGKIVIDNELRVRTSSPSVPGCDVEVNGIYQMEGGQRFSPVKSLVFSATGKYSATEKAPSTTVVYEKYAPNLNEKVKSGTLSTHPPVQLGDSTHLATTLDLSLFTNEVLTAGNTLTFAAGSSVTVKTGERTDLAPRQKLVEWSAAPNATVSFSLVCDGTSAEDRNLTVVAKSDGLYLKSTLIPKYAKWNLQDEVWEFFNEDGTEYADDWEEGVTDDMDVHFSSFAEYEAIKTKNVAPLHFYLTGLTLAEGAGFANMADGFAFEAYEGLSIDVKGNRLRLPHTMVGGVTAFTVTSSVAGGVFDIWVPTGTTISNTKVTITGGNKMQVWKTGGGKVNMLLNNSGYGTGGTSSAQGPIATIVKEGYMKKGNDNGSDSPSGGNACFCGAAYCRIKVERGGQFDIGGRITWDYNYDIAGDGPEGAALKGALINTVQAKTNPWHHQDNRGYLQNLTLSDDASIGGNVIWALHWWYAAGDSYIYLNGHTLTFAGVGGNAGRIYLPNKRKIIGTGGITIDAGSVLNTYEGSTSATGCVFRVDGTYLQQSTDAITPVKSFIFGATGSFNDTGANHAATVVYETYAPNLNVTSGSKSTHPKVQLGASGHTATTLDLTRFSAPFDAGGTLSFFAGSTVTVDVSGRADIHALSRSKDAVTGNRNGYLVTWDAATWTAVSQATPKVTFELSGEAKDSYRLRANENGILITPPAGCMIFVR